MKPTLCIGDVHGHLDRLEALLEQEGVINREGRRINGDVEVVQLGDLGHFGQDGNPYHDFMCWHYGKEWFDVILWGNHDRAVVDAGHAFRGFQVPQHYPQVPQAMNRLERENKLRWAHAAHGHLLTHAGLHRAFRYNSIPVDKKNPEDVAQWLNGVFGQDMDLIAVRNAIGRRRGGSAPAGGILWRDIDEGLYSGFPQVFGHSADHKKQSERYCWEAGHTRKLEHFPDNAKNVSYCIDIGGKDSTPGAPGHALMGLWLPEGRIVRVDL